MNNGKQSIDCVKIINELKTVAQIIDIFILYKNIINTCPCINFINKDRCLNLIADKTVNEYQNLRINIRKEHSAIKQLFESINDLFQAYEILLGISSAIDYMSNINIKIKSNHKTILRIFKYFDALSYHKTANDMEIIDITNKCFEILKGNITDGLQNDSKKDEFIYVQLSNICDEIQLHNNQNKGHYSTKHLAIIFKKTPAFT